MRILKGMAKDGGFLASKIKTKAQALDAGRAEKSSEGEVDWLDRDENMQEGSMGLAREYSVFQGMVEFWG